MMLQIGPHQLLNNVVLAPMAGVTDLPFRELCLELGAGLAVAEMLTADPSLSDSRKSQLRRQHSTKAALRSVQIVGNDPKVLAAAARWNADDGADIIDINMGCPAKKVCKKAAGSALLGDEALVADILQQVVAAVDVPVTLKIRTGTSRDHRNGVNIARIAEEAGVQALAVHGRTRADKFNGDAEYDTIAAIVDAVKIPVLANGDINSVGKARQVLNHTGAAGVMIGRAAQGQPWLPGQIATAIATGIAPPSPSVDAQLRLMRRHVAALHDFYGDFMGIRIARKHVAWFLESLLARETFLLWKHRFNPLETTADQFSFLDQLADEQSALASSSQPPKPIEIAA